MNTNDLINALGADAAANPAGSTKRDWSFALLASALAAALIMAATIKIRADIGNVMLDPRFLFKFVATLALAMSAIWLAFELTRPEARPGRRIAALAIAPALVVMAALIELLVVPQSGWASRAIGGNALICTVFVPFLSLAPLAFLLYALSRGAPANPRLAGLVAGLAAGGIGAAAYAAHCIDDSPLFVMLWYTAGIGIVAGLGSLLGPKVLRW